MNCSKCGKEDASHKVGISHDYSVCGECLKLHRQMAENLRLEFVEKLKESEDYFFNSGKEESAPSAVFIDDEEEYGELKDIDNPNNGVTIVEDPQELPLEIFG